MCKVGKEGRLENVIPFLRMICEERWQTKLGAVVPVA